MYLYPRRSSQTPSIPVSRLANPRHSTLDNAWTRSPLLNGPLGYFPPEPIRYLGSLMVRNAIRRKEHAEDHDRRPRRLDVRLAKFAAAAGKADKA